MAIETKVGVYICSGCGIGESLNCGKLTDVATKENKVPICKSNKWLCSEGSVREIEADIANEKLNRVVIAACSQRYFSDLFHFDPNVLVDRVNLREDVAWTHKPDDADTQMLAEDYLRMGIAKVRNSEPPAPATSDVNETILVVGGGVAGLTAALAAAKAGYSVVLTEKENELGGWAVKFDKIAPYEPPYTEPQSPRIDELISEVESINKITVTTSCQIEKISGQPGGFEVVLRIKGGARTELLTVGAIVQATGWRPYDAKKLGNYGYGTYENVITGVELEKRFNHGNKTGILNGKPITSVTFILCAGSRDESHLPYCSTICCAASLKQALYIRQRFPQALIYIVYRDIRTTAQHELFYKRVQSEDRVFLTKGDFAGISKSMTGSLLVDVDNTLFGGDIRIESDLVVLATGMVPTSLPYDVEADAPFSDADGVTLDGKRAAASAEVGSKILNLTYRQGTDLPTLKYGFPDSHYICFPYETRRTGIYAAGAVRAPMDFLASKNDAYGAALKAIQTVHAIKAGKAVHPRSGDMSYPEFFLQRCTQCKRCTEECPFGTLDEDEKGTPKPHLNRCRRCGICLGACPERIISFKDYSIQMISSMIKAIDIPDEDEDKPRILAFMCENDAYPALDVVGKYRLQYDPNVRVIPVRCLGSVNVVWIADALSKGFDGVLMLGCKYGVDYQCHFIHGSELANKRMTNVQEKLKQLVLEPERVKLLTLSIDEYEKLPEIFNSFVEEVRELGPNPYKGM